MITDPVAIVRQAEAVEPADWAAAIELLEQANGASPSGTVENALASLRWRAFQQLAASPPERVPAEPQTSPPVGERGVPEVPLDGLSAGAIRGALLEHGCLLVPRAVDEDAARALAAGIDEGFAAQDATGAHPESSWWTPLAVDGAGAASLGRKWVRGGGGVLLADSPRLMFEVLDLYERLGLRAILTDYLGSRPVLSANKCTLRRVSIGASGDWHQDGAFLGGGIRAINLWLTLTPCGVDAPGLDLVPRRLDEIVETGAGSANFDWAVGPETVAEAAGPSGVIRPRFDAGDLLIFDDLFLHRTAAEPEMSEPRHAVEMWSFAADAYPSGQVPLVW